MLTYKLYEVLHIIKRWWIVNILTSKLKIMIAIMIKDLLYCHHFFNLKYLNWQFVFGSPIAINKY